MKPLFNKYTGLMLCAAGTFFIALSAQASSFDCAKAGTKVEHIICDTPEISKLDEELNTAYKAALKDEKQADTIKQAQKVWMKERNGCADAGCVKVAYEARLSSLVGAHTPTDSKSVAEMPEAATPKLRYAFCDKSKPELYCEGQTGKGYTVCETYLKHLQTLTSPPTCEAPIPPGFKQPDWEEMDITQHLELAYQAEAFFLKNFGGYKHPDFEAWRQTFLQEIKEGKVNPRMRKAKVMPNDKGEAVILAYTRDRDACRKSYEWEKHRKVQIDQLPASTPAWSIEKQIPGYPYPYWSNQGDVHFTLTDEIPSKLEVIGGDASRAQMELLLYAGKAYLVQILEPLAPIYNGLGSHVRTANTSSIAVFSFAPQFPDRVQLYLKLDHYYAVNALCQLLPY